MRITHMLRTNWIRIALWTLFAGMLACGTTDERPRVVEPATPFELSVGEHVRLESGLAVTFLEVTGDSRCPRDVTCIHAGEATVLVRVASKEKEIGRFELTALDRTSASAEFEGYVLHLEELKTYPVSTRTIPPEAYVAVLEIRRSRDG